VRIIDLDDLRRGIYKKKKQQEDNKDEGKTENYLQLT